MNTRHMVDLCAIDQQPFNHHWTLNKFWLLFLHLLIFRRLVHLIFAFSYFEQKRKNNMNFFFCIVMQSAGYSLLVLLFAFDIKNCRTPCPNICRIVRLSFGFFFFSFFKEKKKHISFLLHSLYYIKFSSLSAQFFLFCFWFFFPENFSLRFFEISQYWMNAIIIIII